MIKTARIIFFLFLISGFPALPFTSHVSPFTSPSYASPVNYYEINGPKQFSITTLNNMRIDTIDKDTVIHVPDSAKVLLVEEFKPKTDYFETEVRAYTYQQAFYWILATAILVYVRQHS